MNAANSVCDANSFAACATIASNNTTPVEKFGAKKAVGIDISAFCYHPGLAIVAQCRQCLVAVEKSPKLQPSCQQVVAEGKHGGAHCPTVVGGGRDGHQARQDERRRRSDALLLAAVTDGLNRLFSNAIPPIRLARDLGLALVHRLPPVKRLLMRHAMGTSGDRPRLARGEKL